MCFKYCTTTTTNIPRRNTEEKKGQKNRAAAGCDVLLLLLVLQSGLVPNNVSALEERLFDRAARMNALWSLGTVKRVAAGDSVWDNGHVRVHDHLAFASSGFDVEEFMGELAAVRIDAVAYLDDEVARWRTLYGWSLCARRIWWSFAEDGRDIAWSLALGI